ncbi:ABC transporter ATP-binding protein [Pseudonocardia sp.]|uniref:ABC transporter ATP-binding protein n=1 Tax=Pseudonocardia sp. TaxID=60912 RepID=UPI003D0DB522
MDLHVEGVKKVYGDGPSARLALDETSFVIESGQFVSIVGPSGCGKSTLLMMMAGLLTPTAGGIRLGDKAISGPPPGVAVVFQDYGRSLFPWMTVGKNLSMAAAADKLPKAEVARRVDEALKAVDLAGTQALYPWQMSGGMQQRVAIARALVVEPTVMLMDEPLAAVDAQTRADLEDLVLALRDRYNMTVAMVTHDIDEAVYVADRVIVLAAHPGRLIADIPVDLGRRDQLTTKAEPEFVKRRAEVFTLVRRPAATPSAAEEDAGVRDRDAHPTELKA